MEKPTDPTHPTGQHEPGQPAAKENEGKTPHPGEGPQAGEPLHHAGAEHPSAHGAPHAQEGRSIERGGERLHGARGGARGTAAMDPKTRQEVARKGGLAVSRNKQHMAEIGRKGGQTVSKNREHMATIGRKGGEASRGRG